MKIIKISDFGINFDFREDWITESEEIVGNKYFICPEAQDRWDEHPDFECDVYSLGKLLYHLLSNGVTFIREKYDEPQNRLVRIQNDDRFEVFTPIFKKTITEVKEERFSSVEELKAAFNIAVEEFNS